MNKKILFILPKFEYGGTVFSTFNMVSLLKDEYDIYIQPMVSVGPVKSYYKGLNVLPPIRSIEAVFINKTELYEKKLYYMLIKLINHISIWIKCPLLKKFYKNEAERIMKEYHFGFVASCQEGDSTEFVSYFEGAKKIAWFRSEYSVYRTRHSEEYEAKLRHIYNKIDTVVCVSNTTRDDFAYWFNNIGDRVVAIHNIQNVDNILKKSSEHIDDPFDKDFFNIVTVGRFSPQKRFASIPEIAHKLIQAGCKFRWYIIGDGNIEGEYDSFMKAQELFSTKESVISIGSRLNPYPYIASADLFVITSSYEACPRVVAEAQILHTPVVSADYSSAPEFVNDDTNGIVVDVEHIHEPIIHYIQNVDEYNEVKKKCQNYNSDNESILLQLNKLFSN